MGNDRTDIRSRALDLLRFPLAIVIVIVHIFMNDGITIQGNEYTWSEDSVVGIVINLVKSFLSVQSVPIYYFISGYVFYLGFKLTKESYFKKLRNRSKSLFTPYILWNTLAIIFMLIPLLPGLGNLFPSINTEDPVNMDLPTLLSMYWESGTSSILNYNVPVEQAYMSFPIDGPMWFVRDLMIVAITTPIVYLILRRVGKWFPIALGAVWFCLPNIDAEHNHIYQIVTAYLFFSWGGLMSIKNKDMIIEFKKYKKCSFITYPVVAILIFISIYAFGDATEVMNNGIHGWLAYIKNIAILSGLPFAYNLAVVLIEKYDIKLAPYLTSASFFIYAGHIIIIPYIIKLVGVILVPDTGFKALLLFILTTIIVVGLLLGTYMGLKRVAPCILKPFTGGRL